MTFSELANKEWFGVKHLTFRKGIQFCVVGTVGFLINGALQLSFRHSDLPSIVYIIVANVPGVLCNFVLNALWTFRR